jgi:hypothetical protein
MGYKRHFPPWVPRIRGNTDCRPLVHRTAASDWCRLDETPWIAQREVTLFRTTHIIVQLLEQFHWECLADPPYRPEVARSDFHLSDHCRSTSDVVTWKLRCLGARKHLSPDLFCAGIQQVVYLGADISVTMWENREFVCYSLFSWTLCRSSKYEWNTPLDVIYWSPLSKHTF